MTDIPESHRDLLDSPIAMLATIAPDGRPQVSAIWFLFEDGQWRTSLNETRKKMRNLRANPAATVFILDLANPLRYLELRGDARIEPDDDYAFARRLGPKYNADVPSFDPPGQKRVVVTLEPERVNAVNMAG
jgi:PPOX class probable F420-dependent enzyme